MKNYRIENAWICQVKANSVKPVFGDLQIENGKIGKIIPKSFKTYLTTKQKTRKNDYNAAGAVVTVPLVNFHEHFYSRLAKGLNVKGSTEDFLSILHNLWWKLDRALTKEMVSASAKMGAIEAIKSGVTYIFDHHASMTAIDGSLDLIATELINKNLRGVLCFEATDRNGVKVAEKSLAENINFLKQFEGDDIKSMLGLHASFTVSDDTLDAASKYLREYDLGIHIHLCEDAADRALSKEVTGKFPVQRLKRYGLLNDKSILAHGIYLTKKDCEIIDEAGPALAFNPDSNLNNGVGTPDFIGLPESIPMLTGTDGMHANPGRSLKNVFLIMRAEGLSFEDSFRLISKIYFNQIEFVRKYFSDYPSLSEGDRADFVVWDYVPPTPLNSNNFFGHYLYGVLERQPKRVVQQGDVLLQDKILTKVNEEEINKEIFEQGEKLVRKFNRKK